MDRLKADHTLLQKGDKMRKLDIKSFLIGVLVTTNIFFFMGFSSNESSNEPYYDNDDLMKELKSQYEETNRIIKRTEIKVDNTYGQVIRGVLGI